MTSGVCDRINLDFKLTSRGTSLVPGKWKRVSADIAVLVLLLSLNAALFFSGSSWSFPYALFNESYIVLLLVTMAAALIFLYLIVSQSKGGLTRIILEDRWSCLPAMGHLVAESQPAESLFKRCASFIIFFVAFLVYFTTMALVFYSLGGPLFSDPVNLTTAAFLGTSVVHVSGRVSKGSNEALPGSIFEFLLPVGLVFGLFVLASHGPDSLTWLNSLVNDWGVVVVPLFVAYTIVDILADPVERVAKREWRRKPPSVAR